MSYEMILDMGFSQKQIQFAKSMVGDNVDLVLDLLITLPPEPPETKGQACNRPMLTSSAKEDKSMPEIVRQNSYADPSNQRQYSEIRIKKTQSVQQPPVQQNQPQKKIQECYKPPQVQSIREPDQQARIPLIPVGIQYSEGPLSSYLLLLFQDPLIVSLILRYDQEQDEDDEFRVELQKIILQLLISKQRMISAERLQKVFEKFRKFKMQEVNFQYFLKRLDYYFRVEIMQSNVKFQNQMLQKQFCGSINNQKDKYFEILQADVKDKFLHNTLWKYHQKNTIHEFPPNFNIIIPRTDKSRYSFPKVLEIDFPKMRDFVTFFEHNNYVELYEKIEDIKLVLAHYNEQPFVLEDVLADLKGELQELKNQMLFYQKADGQLKYHLQAILTSQMTVYTYNFTVKRWYKYTNSIVIPSPEEDVLLDGYLNATQLAYINEEQKEIVLDFEQQRQEIANRVHASTNYEALQDVKLIRGIPNTIYNQLIQ